MARCSNCHNKWKLKDVWLLGFSKKGRVCPYCKARQFPSFKDRGFLLGLGYLSGTIGIILIIFFPFIIQLSNQDETIYE